MQSPKQPINRNEEIQLLETIVDSSPLAIIVTDENGIIHFWNKGAENMFGYTKQEIIDSFYPIIPVNQEAEFRETLSSLLSNGQPLTYRHVKRRRKDNTPIDVHIYVELVKGFNQSQIMIIIEDITQMKKDELKIKQTIKELENFKFALNASSIVAFTDAQGVITYVNNKFCEVSQYEQHELLGNTHRIINSGYHDKRVFRELWTQIKAGHVWSGQLKNKRKDGSYYWVSTTIIPFTNEEGKIVRFVSIRNEITEQKLAEEKIHHMAYHDDLTNLPNQRYLKEKLTSLLTERKEKVAVISLDMDRFKNINDALGHSIGDYFLVKFSNKVSQLKQKWNLFIARQGGDEFVILLNYEKKTELMTFLEQLKETMNFPITLRKQQYFITSSFGVSLFPSDGDHADVLLKKAEMAMYQVKQSGRNSYQFFTKDMDSNIYNELETEMLLRKANLDEEMELYYQPKISLKTGQLAGVEALLRWHNPKLGTVPPSIFIPIAEETGLITSIGDWVLEKVCHKLKEWSDYGYNVPKISINLSVRQFQNDNLVNTIKEIITTVHINPALLELEITESIAMDNYEFVKERLDAIKQLGISISIDDFGTGYSSLSNLRKYAIDSLKIDKSFLDDFLETGDTSIVKTIIALAHNLNLKVIAEGVEVERQLTLLKSLDCDEVQGYYFNKPLNINEFEKQYLEIDAAI